MDEEDATVHRSFAVVEVCPDRRRDESAKTELAQRKTTQIDVIEADS